MRVRKRSRVVGGGTSRAVGPGDDGPASRVPRAVPDHPAALHAAAVLAFNSKFPSKKGGYSLKDARAKIEKELNRGENVIIDQEKLIPEQIAVGLGASFTGFEMHMADALDMHARWVTSGGSDGEQLSVSDLDFRGANLAGHVLTEAEVPGSDFDGAQMSSTDLFGANVASSSFRNVNLAGAVLSKANADHANFENSDLSDAKLFRATLVNGRLRGAVLRNADLRYADLTDADLSGTDLRGAMLEGAILSGALVYSARFDEATGMEKVEVDSLAISHEESLTTDVAKAWLLDAVAKPRADQ